jgi:hypothetical protein
MPLALRALTFANTMAVWREEPEVGLDFTIFINPTESLGKLDENRKALTLKKFCQFITFL